MSCFKHKNGKKPVKFRVILSHRLKTDVGCGSGRTERGLIYSPNFNQHQNFLLMQLKKLTPEDVIAHLEYFSRCKLLISDYSAAFKLMWQDYYTQYYAEVEGCLIFQEYYQGRVYFHYPMSLDDDAAEDRALDRIEQYCRENDIRLHYTSIPREKLGKFADRYGADLRLDNKRCWRDYLYRAQDFVSYAGKKFSGQRNHVNKFRKLYPDYEYCVLTSADSEEITQFLKEFAMRQIEKGTTIAREELQSVFKLTSYLDTLGQLAGGIRVGGKLVSYAVGEVCGNQLIIHVEKALTQYEGIYATTAQEFARHNVADGIDYINREDDSGDAGLRKSKLQYNPICLVDKYNVTPHRAIDSVRSLPDFRYGRLIIREITDMYSNDFFRLEYDAGRNKYWGYNWREHFSGEPTPEYFMRGIREDFKDKNEMPLGIFFEGCLAGEVVLHNFGFRNDCEIGVRLLPQFEGKGLAREALLGLMNYAFFELDIDTVLAKCYKENERSRRTLLSAGMKQTGQDDVYYYFKKTAAM